MAEQLVAAILRKEPLIDVSDIAERIGILFPVAVSPAIYYHKALDRSRLNEQLETFINESLGSSEWLAGDAVGEFTWGFLIDQGEIMSPFRVWGVIEWNEDKSGVVASLYLEREKEALEAKLFPERLV